MVNTLQNAHSKGKALLLVTLSFASLFLLSGCSTNPATGQQQFTALMSPAQENRIGVEQHQAIDLKFCRTNSPWLRQFHLYILTVPSLNSLSAYYCLINLYFFPACIAFEPYKPFKTRKRSSLKSENGILEASDETVSPDLAVTISIL